MYYPKSSESHSLYTLTVPDGIMSSYTIVEGTVSPSNTVVDFFISRSPITNFEVPISDLIDPRLLNNNSSLVIRVRQTGSINLNFEYFEPTELYVAIRSTTSTNGTLSFTYNLQLNKSEYDAWLSNSAQSVTVSPTQVSGSFKACSTPVQSGDFTASGGSGNYRWSIAPDTYKLTSTGSTTQITLPTDKILNNEQITLTATDSEDFSLSANATYTLSVTGNPDLQSTINPVTIHSGADLSISLSEYLTCNAEGNADAVDFSISDAKKDGVDIQSPSYTLNNGQLNWSSDDLSVGSYSFKINTSASGETDSVDFNFTVIEPTPPEFNDSFEIASEGQPIKDKEFTFDLNNMLTQRTLGTSWGFIGAVPSDMTLNSSTGILTWSKPTAGSTTVMLFADNGVGDGDIGYLNLNVADITIPSIESIPNATRYSNRAFTYDVNPSSDSGNLKFYIAINGQFPMGLDINATTGVISWPEPVPGDYSIDIVGIDHVLFKTYPNSPSIYSAVESFDLHVLPEINIINTLSIKSDINSTRPSSSTPLVSLEENSTIQLTVGQNVTDWEIVANAPVGNVSNDIIEVNSTHYYLSLTNEGLFDYNFTTYSATGWDTKQFKVEVKNHSNFIKIYDSEGNTLTSGKTYSYKEGQEDNISFTVDGFGDLTCNHTINTTAHPGISVDGCNIVIDNTTIKGEYTISLNFSTTGGGSYQDTIKLNITSGDINPAILMYLLN